MIVQQRPVSLVVWRHECTSGATFGLVGTGERVGSWCRCRRRPGHWPLAGAATMMAAAVNRTGACGSNTAVGMPGVPACSEAAPPLPVPVHVDGKREHTNQGLRARGGCAASGTYSGSAMEAESSTTVAVRSKRRAMVRLGEELWVPWEG